MVRVSMVAAVVVMACGGGRPAEPVADAGAGGGLGGGAGGAGGGAPVVVGPALEVHATRSGAHLEVTVTGRSFGPVLGYAFALKFEGLAPQGEATTALALGPVSAGEAMYLTRLSTGVLRVGGVRQGLAAGERVIDAETELTRQRFDVTHDAFTLTLADVSVRRANGDGVVVTAVGAGGAR
ncbi:MAG: hypothetical protein IPJ65_29875 [Archangiaceae bacterium]|nr:hypothetical protein [Archangiaceae bacterium]